MSILSFKIKMNRHFHFSFEVNSQIMKRGVELDLAHWLSPDILKFIYDNKEGDGVKNHYDKDTVIGSN